MHEVIERGLEDYLAGSSDREFALHLAQCSSCRQDVEQMRQVSNLLSSLRFAAPAGNEVAMPPLGFAPRVMRGLAEQKNRSFWSVFSTDEGFARKLAFGSVLSLIVLGSFLAVQSGDVVAQEDHTPEAVISSHVHSSGDSEGMLVTLASYHE